MITSGYLYPTNAYRHKALIKDIKCDVMRIPTPQNRSLSENITKKRREKQQIWKMCACVLHIATLIKDINKKKQELKKKYQQHKVNKGEYI